MMYLRNASLVSAGLLGLMLVGCAQPAKVSSTRPSTQKGVDFDQTADQIRKDAVAYLESCLDRCRAIQSLSTTFYRQERLGIVPVLQPVERIHVKWRRTPLSIKFDLPDETSEYLESTYVEGKNKNQLQVLARHGLFGLPPSVLSVPPSWSISLHKAKNPIVDFGPERMLERAMKKIILARKYGGPFIEYKGIVKLDVSNQIVHHIQIVNPPQPDFPHCKVDLYIDPVLQIPAGSYCWAKPDMLDAMYLFADMKLNPVLTDADFTIVKATTSRPTTQPKPTTRAKTP